MNAPFPDLHHLRFPGENAEYRAARNALLAEEMELRRQTERVAAQRRALPAGGALAKDYLFEGPDGPVKLSELFAPGKDTLAIYSFMYGPEREEPCPGCTHFLDGLDGMVEHIAQRLRLAVVAKSPLPRILTLARDRGWRRLPLCLRQGTPMTGTISVTQRPCPTPSVCSRISSPVRNGTCRCLTSSGARATRSGTSGVANFCTYRPSLASNTATTTCSIRSGTCWI
jgi:hypothetical protein